MHNETISEVRVCNQQVETTYLNIDAWINPKPPKDQGFMVLNDQFDWSYWEKQNSDDTKFYTIEISEENCSYNSKDKQKLDEIKSPYDVLKIAKKYMRS